MGDDLGVGLRGERVALLDQRVLELAEVLHDPVEDDRDLVLDATCQRVRVLERDLAVRGPARVADPCRGSRAVEAGRGLQLVEVADGADVVEPLVLEQRDAGRVIAAVLETLEPVKEERVRLPGAHVSDDPAHLEPLSSSARFVLRRAFRRLSALLFPENLPENENARLQPSSRETRARDPTTEAFRGFLGFGLDEDPDDGLGSGRANHDAPANREAVDLVLEGRRNLL